MDNTSTFNVVERMEADRELKKAIENGHKAAFLALGLDFITKEVDIQLKSILGNIQKILPDNTPQRVYLSYGWLILCTEMVNINKTIDLDY